MKELLGHRDIKTTERYSHLTPDFMREPVSKGSLFSSGEIQRKDGIGTKTGTGHLTELTSFAQLLDMMVRPVGIEPTTLSLEG